MEQWKETRPLRIRFQDWGRQQILWNDYLSCVVRKWNVDQQRHLILWNGFSKSKVFGQQKSRARKEINVSWKFKKNIKKFKFC